MEKYTIFNFGLLHLEWTNALFVFIIFSTVVFLLHFLLFKPIIRTITNRENNQNLSQNEVAELQKNIEQISIKTTKIQEAAFQEIAVYREKEMKETNQKISQVVTSLRANLENKAVEFRTQLQQEIKKLELSSDKISDNLLEQLKQKI